MFIRQSSCCHLPLAASVPPLLYCTAVYPFDCAATAEQVEHAGALQYSCRQYSWVRLLLPASPLPSIMPKTLPAEPFKIPPKKGRPRRETPYSLPPLPSKNSKLPAKQKKQQRAQRAILQNNAASLRYRRNQVLKREQQQMQLKEMFEQNARLHLRIARMKSVVNAINTRVSQLAQQGCDHCLQTTLLLQQSSSPQPPMVKIEPDIAADLEDLPWVVQSASNWLMNRYNLVEWVSLYSTNDMKWNSCISIAPQCINEIHWASSSVFPLCGGFCDPAAAESSERSTPRRLALL